LHNTIKCETITYVSKSSKPKEQVMFTSIILSAIIALSALFGQAPASQVEAPKGGVDVGVECMEDMPCWDPETMGNGHEANPMEADAYLSYDALGATPNLNNDMILSYVGTHYTEGPAPTLAPNQFTVSSVDYPETYHVMQWDTLSHA
jgi:hypothetical protein